MGPIEIAIALGVVACAAALAGILIALLKPLLLRYLVAHPNTRSSHKTPTPQGAGVAVIAAVLVTSAATFVLFGGAEGAAALVPVLAAALALTLLGLADDARALAVHWRFAGQTLAALVMVYVLPADLRVFPSMLSFLVERALMVLGAVWFINAVNFLDGIDWITVAQTVPMTLAVAVLSALGAVPGSVGVLALALCGSMLGFAVFNKHPAQVFLGDAGSLPIGLLLAFMLIWVGGFDAVAAMLLALYTMADATITLLRRAYNLEPIFSAHRSHFYQRAVINGLTVPEVSARVFGLCLLLASLAIASVLMQSPLANLVLLGLGAIATAYVLNRLARGRA